MKKLVVSFALLALIGAGCPTAPSGTTPQQGERPPAQVPTRMGFGKLPALGASGALGSPEARSATISMNAAPMMAADTAQTEQGTWTVSAGGGTAGVATMVATPSMAPVTDLKIRPVPMPPPNLKPVNIKYNLTATLPDWGTDSDVLEVERMQMDSSLVRGFAANAGLPGPIVSGIADIQSINVSWKDNNGFVWNTDGASGNLNWWKQQNDVQQLRNDQMPPAKQDDTKIIAAADAFLRSHGLGAVADQGATVEQYNQPCLMKADAGSAPAAMMKDDSASTMIYPSPCGYYVVQATVFYGVNREGKPVVDMGGWPSRMSSVSVDTNTLEVTSGNVVYSENIARSSYPLLDKDTVMKRLQDGGRNPVYPWGNETKDVQVTIDKVELAWLRFDSWADNQQQTYFIPAIAASGHVDRGIKGQEPEEYHTTVALVKDDAFADVAPQPIPPIMPMMENSVAPAQAPVKY